MVNESRDEGKDLSIDTILDFTIVPCPPAPTPSSVLIVDKD